MKLPADWSEFIALLSSHRVRFLVVGAHAMAAHGVPRFTQDLDLLVEPTAENARRLGAALADFGFAALSRSSQKLASPDRMVTLGRPPLRIDVMTTITGVTFAQAWKGRSRVRIGRRIVGILGIAELVANKRASARTKDLLDIALLEEAGIAPKQRRAPSKRRGR